MSVEEFLDKLFQKFDSNKDGRLSWYQFTQAIKFLTKVTGTTLPKKSDMKEIFVYIDKDGDDSLSKD